ncbi:MAG: hypothetical protein DRJ03_01495 [Chloroflexi bacterium]|nr:MAG: hypothetical protein DRJ03_01495 [Chloroflexota bacterium]
MPEQTFQPAAADGKDTWINSRFPANNYGASTTMSLGYSSNPYSRDIHIAFDLTPIKKGSKIEIATMSLYCDSKLAGVANVEIRRILEANAAWTEGGADWNTMDGVNAWAGGAGCEVYGVDIANTTMYSSASVNTAVGAWEDFSLDVGEFQALIDVGNYGIKLFSTERAAGTNAGLDYRTSDHATANTRPKLYVRWIEPSGRLVEYTFDIWDPKRRIKDQQGRIVPPEEVEPDNWMRVLGISMPGAKVFESLVEDWDVVYIMETAMSGRGLRMKGNRNELAEVIISRAAGGKG